VKLRKKVFEKEIGDAEVVELIRFVEIEVDERDLNSLELELVGG